MKDKSPGNEAQRCVTLRAEYGVKKGSEPPGQMQSCLASLVFRKMELCTFSTEN